MRRVSLALIFSACASDARRASLSQAHSRKQTHVEVTRALNKLQTREANSLETFVRFLLAFDPSAAASFSSSPGTRTPQVLRFRDAITLQEVRLVGTVHFHPVSITRAREEIAEALKQHNSSLAAVVIEQDASKWQKMLEEEPPGSENILDEFRGAAGIAWQNGVPIMLGDTDSQYLGDRVGAFVGESVRDLLNPIGGGWQAVFNDTVQFYFSMYDNSDIAQSALLLDAEEPLSLGDYLQPEMLKGFLQIPDPLRRAIIYVWLAVVLTLPFMFKFDMPKPIREFGWGEYSIIPLFFVWVIQSILLTRTTTVVIDEERNAELARSIRRAAAERNAPVVAIMGAAHVNKVARLLLSKELPDSDGRNNDGVWWEVPAQMNLESWT